jgi:hypothetical protein
MERKDWENDGDPCNDCGEPAAYDEAAGWYYHLDPNAPGCFLMGSGVSTPPRSTGWRDDPFTDPPRGVARDWESS